jgi:hypothetical protein
MLWVALFDVCRIRNGKENWLIVDYSLETERFGVQGRVFHQDLPEIFGLKYPAQLDAFAGIKNHPSTIDWDNVWHILSLFEPTPPDGD